MWDRPLRVGIATLDHLEALGMIEFGVPEGCEELSYRSTESGAAARREYFECYGEVLED